MIDFAGNVIEVNGCYGCAYAAHEFSLITGIEYEDENFTLSQDWELPIQGFYVATPKRHVESLSELTDKERNDIFALVNHAIKVLKEARICDNYNVIFEEKPTRHFHIWIMPRHKWMKDLVGDITKHIETIFIYAKENLKTKENIDKIREISQKVKEGFKDFKL